MKKYQFILATALAIFGLTSCGDDSYTIRVCASELPHAQVLNNYVKDALQEKGYKLIVSTLNWGIQNDGVSQKDYDANYFQHLPFLNNYNGKVELAFTCTVHYEPLGIYKGNGKVSSLSEGKTFAICNDPSNGLRAFELLAKNNVISESEIPSTVDEEGNTLFDETRSEWDNESQTKWSNNQVTITLLEESLLATSRPDYDFVLLPCNTAYTGNVDVSSRVAVENDETEITNKANGIAVRKNDYLNNETYRNKIDALTDVMLSKGLSDYFNNEYRGVMICDERTQIDMRNLIK